MTDLTVKSAGAGVKRGEDNETCDRIFVKDLILDCEVGVYDEEQGVGQKVGFTVEADVPKSGKAILEDDISSVPSYDDLTRAVKETAAEGHINLVETFAERIAQRVLFDKRIARVRVRVEKLERGPGAVGIEIVRTRSEGA